MSQDTVRTSIKLSISYDEIVILDWSAEREEALQALSDDQAQNDDTFDFWGHEEGERWRILLIRRCAYCGKPFTTTPIDKRGELYCSESCADLRPESPIDQERRRREDAEDARGDELREMEVRP